MLVPSIFGRDMFNDFFTEPFGGYRTHDLMKTDVKDTDRAYELTMDMPGVKKEDVKAELKDGYLTVSAESGYSNDDKDSEGRYIRRERHYGSCSRSFYVGDNVTRDEIKASFENGTLKLTIPKKEEKPLSDGGNYIRIEG
ncbi:MAG: Hsp20/alpha crystallin family protein [Clostridiales bacterium]|nr:Hsp20/alpha crystallin family protein [Clostridiales bacterium]